VGDALAALQLTHLHAVQHGVGVEQGIHIEPGLLIGIPPVTVTRPSDLLRLRFSFDNLRLVESDGRLVLTRSKSTAQARLIVDHQPQHLVEEAGYEALDKFHQPLFDKPQRPVHPRLSTHSRLVFSVGTAQIPWTLDGLLGACTTLPLLLAPNAQIEPALIGRFEMEAGSISAGVLATQVALGKVKPTAETAPSVAVTLGTLQRTLRAARIIDDRVGPGDTLAALSGMQLGGHLGVVEVGEGISVVLRHPTPQVPTQFQTSLELPWRLKLSPGPSGAWVHRPEPVDHDGRVELWHSRLGRRTGSGADAVVREADAYVRAIWTRDFDQFPKALEFPKELAGPGEQPPPVEGDNDVPTFRKSLTSARRMKIVHESGNFALKYGNADYVPRAVRVDNLMLTSLGGWLSSKLTVDKPPGGQLDLTEWQHVATMGRDHYVKVMELGFLFPFGHRAVLVTIAERKFQPSDPGNPAFVFVRSFVSVVEPTRTFTSEHTYVDDRGLPDAPSAVNRRLDLVMPFSSVTVLTKTTPLLDERTGSTGGGRLPGMPNEFFPTVAGTTFGFRVLAADRLGNVAEYPAPLLFLTQGTNDDPALLKKAIEAYYALDTTQVQHRLGGQRVGYAPDVWEGQPLDTTLATQQLRWDAAADGFLTGPSDRPHFAPMLRRASVVVPSISALAGKSDAVDVRYPSHYGALGMQGNAARVFLAVDGRPGLSFSSQADRSGGFVAPNLAITGLSGATGPIGGSLDNAVSGATNPADFFGGLADEAKLFGIVSLKELLVGLAPSGFPSFVADQVNRITALQQDLARIVALAEQLPDRIAGLAEAGTAQAQAVVDAVEDVGAKAALVLQSLAAYTPGGPLAGRADDLAAALGGLASALDAADFLPRAVRGDASSVVRRLRENVEDAGELVALMDAVAGGLSLPESVKARLHWSTELKAWPDPGKALFQPRPKAGQDNTTARTTLDLSVEMQAPTKPGKEPSAIASCSLTPFSLRLLGKEPFISLDVDKIEFLMQTGKKTDVNVVFAGEHPVTFGGPLSWVNVLQDFIPFDGFSDPPYLEVSTAGIKAGFDLPLPDIPLGVLNLTQVSLGAEVNVPFLGEPLDFRFYFCTRERPFHLTVWVFGGGGFFSITVTPEECKILEAAFEFGACASIDFGVASGSIEVMAGIYFRLQKGNSELTGYFRLRGEVDVLGLISASLELYLELSYEIDTKTARGRAELTIEVEVLMFSTSVTIECEKKFQGSDQDPTFVEVMGPAPGDPVDVSPWSDYCLAFAKA
jgi:hypothetical protein